MSGGQEVESEDDWLFDYMMETFRSPTWEVPVMTFIDENCVIFDNDEENKLVYTEKHREFCQLIDNLLSSHLSEIGVSEVQFAKAVVHRCHATGSDSSVYSCQHRHRRARDDVSDERAPRRVHVP